MTATANEIWQMDASTIARKVKSREISPVEVTKAHLDRMDAMEPRLHAFCTPTPELALKAARSLEADILGGKEVGLLAGVPVGLKDLICTKGILTASGSPAYADFVPDEDDIVVERIKAADAIILGKTNVPELGYSGAGHNPIFETTRNPWNTALTSGGSSAGSGAAVASGMCPLALGSDGGGSIRIPAAHCGIYGLKASMGRVPLYPGTKDERFPGVSSWESLEHIGPMTRNVADAALVMQVLAGPDPRDRFSIPAAPYDWRETVKGDISGLRVGFSIDWGYAAVDSEVRRLVTDAAKVFETDLGCTVDEVVPGWEDPFAAFWGLVALESDLKGLREMARTYGSRMSPHLVNFINTPWTAEDLTSAVMTRKAVANKMWRLMRDYDILLTPTLAVPPFAIDIQGPEKIDGRMVATTQWLAFTFPLNMTGQPAASIPAGFTREGLPVGLQIIGQHLDDATVLRASAAFERARPWSDSYQKVFSS
jgi:aspartyl-tRNA(Asn)/glutamyl-tRNA(Gln) amidotransferase subunit A